MDGLDSETLDKMVRDVFNSSPINSEDEYEFRPIVKCLGITRSSQRRRKHATKASDTPTKTRSEIEHELELNILRPDSIRRQIMEQSLAERKTVDSSDDSDSGSSQYVDTVDRQEANSFVSNNNHSSQEKQGELEQTNHDVANNTPDMVTKEKEQEKTQEETVQSHVTPVEPIQQEHIYNTPKKVSREISTQTTPTKVLQETSSTPTKTQHQPGTSNTPTNTLQEAPTTNTKVFQQTTNAPSDNTQMPDLDDWQMVIDQQTVATVSENHIAEQTQLQQIIFPATPPKLTLYQKFVKTNERRLSPKVDPFQCPYCLHGFLEFRSLEKHAPVCIKNRGF